MTTGTIHARHVVRPHGRRALAGGTTPPGGTLRACRVRSWTGRAVTARATASGVPHVVTSGTHRTRVSEMRDARAALPPVTASTRRALARRRPIPGDRGVPEDRPIA
jgi:hypothetical protein